MLEQVCNMLDKNRADVGSIRETLRGKFGEYKVYPDSINYLDGSFFFMVLVNHSKKLIIYHKGKVYDQFTGEEKKYGDKKIKICDLSNENSAALREAFKFTAPSPHKGIKITMGLGDRLGLASAGHIRTIKGKNVFPVLAQQSIRELNLTERTFKDVLSAASWAVFQEGHTSGFGADGDHLKTADEVKTAIDCGYTMITLDCSEHINNTIPSLREGEIDSLYAELPADDRRRLENKYPGRKFELVDGAVIEFTEEEFRKIVLIYIKAIRHTINIYNHVIKNCGRAIDFEMSIDETLTPTSPASHYFVASELILGGVDITSLAPRFCGEFQKGIDYIGDIKKFAAEFYMHVKIAEKLGYKISVHSGSDKFSIFPIVGEKTNGRYHLKTAGTNWLEAVRVISVIDPALYRRMHKFALENLEAAKKYYHVSANPAKIPDIDIMKDSELPGLLSMNDSRQVLHIAYGLILTAKNSDGTYRFKTEIYDLLNKYEDKYYEALEKHIGRHLTALGI